MWYRFSSNKVSFLTQNIARLILVSLCLSPSVVSAALYTASLYTINMTNSTCFLVDRIPVSFATSLSIIRENEFSIGSISTWGPDNIQSTWKCGKRAVTVNVKLTQKEGETPLVSGTIVKADPGITAHFNFIAKTVPHWYAPDALMEIILSNQ